MNYTPPRQNLSLLSSPSSPISPSSTATQRTFSSPRVEATFRYHLRKSLHHQQQQRSGSEISATLLTPPNLAMNAPSSYYSSSASATTHTNNHILQFPQQITTFRQHQQENPYSTSIMKVVQKLDTQSSRETLVVAEKNNDIVEETTKTRNDHGGEIFIPKYLGDKYHWVTTTSPQNTLSVFVPTEHYQYHHQQHLKPTRRDSDAETTTSTVQFENFDVKVQRQLRGGLGSEVKNTGVMDSFEKLMKEIEEDNYLMMKKTPNFQQQHQQQEHEHQSTSAKLVLPSSSSSSLPTTAEIVLQTYCWSMKLLFSERESLAQNFILEKQKLLQTHLEESKSKWEKAGPKKRH